MAIVERQNNLFAAEDWKVAYKAFSKINFQAYDFNTMRKAMVDYVKINYPENFNDFIESSEFVAIIELLAYLSTSLAFRMDLNSRENFLETAERRDSVFKLARMLGYNPRRNITASGLVKLTSVQTTEPLIDSQNLSLQNTKVFWDDANNPDSFEQFVTIINSAFAGTNRFTAPVKTGKVGGINTEKYNINTTIGSPISYNFAGQTTTGRKTFQVCNGNFTDNKFFFEETPNPINPFGMFYRNDGLGFSSADTGFFMLFKQGELSFLAGSLGAEQANREADTASKSDRRLKKNITKIGESNRGFNIYSFEYKNLTDGKGLFQGVMSDEIPQEAVTRLDGYDRVNYSMLDVEFKQI